MLYDSDRSNNAIHFTYNIITTAYFQLDFYEMIGQIRLKRYQFCMIQHKLRVFHH